MSDLLLGATAAGASMVAAVTTDIVAEVQRRHDLSPTATAAVGRLVTGAALLGAGLTGHERISLQISGDGPIAAVVADSWLLDERTIGVRGYAQNGKVELPIDARGKFDVAGAIGNGVLQVTKSYEVGQPYVGVVPLQSGEIAEDLAAYLAKSEQIPSVVALGVLANPRGVVAAGGVIAQVLPGTVDASVAALEDRARAMPPVTELVAERSDPLALLRLLSGNERLESTRTMDVRFACLCTKRKVEAALLGLGRAELEGMNREHPQTEATCEFCRRRYVFERGEIAALIDRLEPA